MSRRCVITGMGVVSPLGSTVDSMWENAKNGVCGIENITKFDTTDFKVKVAGEVKDFDPEKYMTKKDCSTYLSEILNLNKKEIYDFILKNF